MLNPAETFSDFRVLGLVEFGLEKKKSFSGLGPFLQKCHLLALFSKISIFKIFLIPIFVKEKSDQLISFN